MNSALTRLSNFSNVSRYSSSIASQWPLPKLFILSINYIYILPSPRLAQTSMHGWTLLLLILSLQLPSWRYISQSQALIWFSGCLGLNLSHPTLWFQRPSKFWKHSVRLCLSAPPHAWGFTSNQNQMGSSIDWTLWDQWSAVCAHACAA